MFRSSSALWRPGASSTGRKAGICVFCPVWGHGDVGLAHDWAVPQVPGSLGNSMPSSSQICRSSGVRLARVSSCCGFTTPGAGVVGRASGERGKYQERAACGKRGLVPWGSDATLLGSLFVSSTSWQDGACLPVAKLALYPFMNQSACFFYVLEELGSCNFFMGFYLVYL